MDNDTDAAPGIRVQPSAIVPLLTNFLRQCGILFAGGTTLIAILGRRDMNELITYINSDGFLLVLAALTFLLSSVASLYRTARNEWVKRVLTAEVGDEVARIEAHGIGKGIIKILAVLGLVNLAGCATMSDGTVAQRLFEARANYIVMKGVAVDYAEGPTADAGVVAALVRIRDTTRPAVDYVDAYGACHGQATGLATLEGRAEPIDCATFNFTATSATSATLALRSAVTQILAKIGRN